MDPEMIASCRAAAAQDRVYELEKALKAAVDFMVSEYVLNTKDGIDYGAANKILETCCDALGGNKQEKFHKGLK